MRSVSGAAVNEHTALRQATVYTCVKILSECIASCAPGLIERVSTNEVNEIFDHPALDVLRTPNDWMSWHDLCQYWITHSELRGNAYAFKVKSGDGRVRELLPLQPDMVGVQQMPDWTIIFTVGSGRLEPNGQYRSDRVLHLKNFGTIGYKGESTIALHRDEIGLGLDMQRHAGALYRNGTNLGTVFQHPKTLSQPAYDRLKLSLGKEFGGVLNTGKPIITEEGMTVEKLGMTMEDAEFIASRHYTKQEIAGIFGVPMFLLNDTEKSTTWGTGLEQVSRAFLNYSLQPRISRLLMMLNRNLLLPKEQGKLSFVVNTDRFTLGDFASRYNGYKTAILAGIMNPDEVRHLEHMNPRPGGDAYVDPQPPGLGFPGENPPEGEPTPPEGQKP
jgi:HK97 family phage portal protein